VQNVCVYSHDALNAVLKAVVAPGAPVVQTHLYQLVYVSVRLFQIESPVSVREQPVL